MQATFTRSPSFELLNVDRRERQTVLAILAVLTVCAALPAAFLPAQQLWLFVAIGLAGVILLEPSIGLYAAVAIVGLDATGPTTKSFMDLFAGLPGIKLTPVELLILWTTLAAYVRTAGQEKVANDRLVLLAVVVFLALVIQAVFLGASEGGDFTVALWEVRAMLSILPMMLLTNVLVRDRAQLRRLAMFIAGVLVLMTVEAFWRYVNYIRPGGYSSIVEFAYSHETSVLVGFLMVACACWSLWGPNRKQRLIALGLVVATGIVETTLRRRAGLIGAEAGVLTVGMLLLIKDFRRFLIIAPIFLIVASAYFAVFWNSTKSAGEPVRAFRTVFDPQATDPRDKASDQYRLAEKNNIWVNIKASPIEGIGFGVPYAKPYPFPNLSSFWPFWDYIPHNTILWLWMKAGVFTFLAFWFMVGAAVVRIVHACRSTSDSFLIAMAASMAAFLVMLVLFSYVDLGLTNVRLMILTGVCFGLVGLLHRLATSPSSQVSSEAGVL